MKYFKYSFLLLGFFLSACSVSLPVNARDFSSENDICSIYNYEYIVHLNESELSQFSQDQVNEVLKASIHASRFEASELNSIEKTCIRDYLIETRLLRSRIRDFKKLQSIISEPNWQLHEAMTAIAGILSSHRQFSPTTKSNSYTTLQKYIRDIQNALRIRSSLWLRIQLYPNALLSVPQFNERGDRMAVRSYVFRNEVIEIIDNIFKRGASDDITASVGSKVAQLQFPQLNIDTTRSFVHLTVNTDGISISVEPNPSVSSLPDFFVAGLNKFINYNTESMFQRTIKSFQKNDNESMDDDLDDTKPENLCTRSNLYAFRATSEIKHDNLISGTHRNLDANAEVLVLEFKNEFAKIYVTETAIDEFRGKRGWISRKALRKCGNQ